MVNKDNAILGVVSRPHGTNIHTGGILTLEARRRHKITAATGEFYFINFNPLLLFGYEMSLNTSLGALGRRINGDTPFALLQVNDHTPGTNFSLR